MSYFNPNELLVNKALAFGVYPYVNAAECHLYLAKQMWEEAGMKVTLDSQVQADQIIQVILGNYQAADFRLFNWEEMHLNEYLYANGEVVKLWLYPRGPDSGVERPDRRPVAQAQGDAGGHHRHRNGAQGIHRRPRTQSVDAGRRSRRIDLGGGLPLSGVVGRAEIMDAVEKGRIIAESRASATRFTGVPSTR